MDAQCLEQSPCPTGALAVKHCQVGRSFRPTASVRYLHYLVRPGEVAHISHHAGNHVHVFRKGSTVITSCRNGYGTVKKPESTGYIRHPVDGRPSHLTYQIGTHIFQVLEKRNRGTRSLDINNLPVLHYAAVSHQHGSAHGNHLFVRRYNR